MLANVYCILHGNNKNHKNHIMTQITIYYLVCEYKTHLGGEVLFCARLIWLCVMMSTLGFRPVLQSLYVAGLCMFHYTCPSYSIQLCIGYCVLLIIIFELFVFLFCLYFFVFVYIIYVCIYIYMFFVLFVYLCCWFIKERPP